MKLKQKCHKCGEIITFNKEQTKLLWTIYSKGNIEKIYGVRCGKCGLYTCIDRGDKNDKDI